MLRIVVKKLKISKLTNECAPNLASCTKTCSIRQMMKLPWCWTLCQASSRCWRTCIRISLARSSSQKRCLICSTSSRMSSRLSQSYSMIFRRKCSRKDNRIQTLKAATINSMILACWGVASHRRSAISTLIDMQNLNTRLRCSNQSWFSTLGSGVKDVSWKRKSSRI